MKLGIIGAGFIGQAVARLMLDNGHQVMISNSRGPHSLYSFKSALPGIETGTTDEACAFGDMVLVAIPFHNLAQLPAKALDGKTVLDANNYYPQRDGHTESLDNHTTTTSQILAAHLQHSIIVKVFNNIMAKHINEHARAPGSPERRALPVACDSEDVRQTVMNLLNELGYDPVDGGSLDESWRFERGKPAYCFPLNHSEMERALSSAERNKELPASAWQSLLES